MDQTELTPALERVAASVVETHRKRQQLEEELKAAAAAVASLHSQSSSLEASIVTLRDALEHAVRLKAQEDAALQSLADKQRAAIEQLAVAARDVETALADHNRVAGAVAAEAETAREHVRDVQSDVATVKAALGGLTSDATTLRKRLADVLTSVETVTAQITDVESKAVELNTAVDGVAAHICVIADGIDKADHDRKNIVAMADGLRTASAALEARRAEVSATQRETEELLSEHARQTAMLSEQIDRLSQLALSSQPPAEPTSPAHEPDVAYEAHRDAKMFAHSHAPAKLASTKELLTLLLALNTVSAEEGGVVGDLLADQDVDKVVRSLWSRAMGGPHPAAYRMIIGSALAESGDHKGAVTFFNKALEGRSVDPMMTYLVALALLRMKRYVDVLRLAQALHKTKHGKVLARNIEALHLAAGGRLAEAEGKLVEALTVPGQPRSHYSETMYNLAQLAQERGASDAAASWLEKIASTDPGYRDLSSHMESPRVDVRSG